MSKAGRDEEDESVPYASKTCIFYKLITSSILQDNKLNRALSGLLEVVVPSLTLLRLEQLLLKIPRKFVRKYGDDLSTNAMLIAPSGCMWPVELWGVDRDLWFDDGWEDFVEFYSIRVGHFLVFEYEKKSVFKVYIYYLPLFETNYPCALPEGQQHSGRASPSPESSRQRAADDGFVETLGVGISCFTPDRSRSNALKDDDMIALQSSGVNAKNMHPVKIEYDVEPSSQFHRDISTTFKGNNSRAWHPPFDETGRRTRSVAELDHQPRQRSKAKLPCIGRSSPGQMRNCRQVTGEEMDRMIRAIDNIKQDHPFFLLFMQPSYVHGGPMHIPTSFSKVHLRSSTISDITLQVSDVQQWRVRCVPLSQGVKFSQGWAEFVHDNNLEPGDACVFELVDTKEVRIKVHIFRVRRDDDQPANRVLA